MSMVFNMVGGGGGSKPKKLLSSLTEGSLVSVLEDGKLTPFYVAKHNYEADLNGEGRTLLVRQYGHSKRQWNSSASNYYKASAIDTWLDGDYKAVLSGTVQAAMSTTSFYSDAGEVLVRSSFLVSATELGASASHIFVLGETLPIASKLQIAYFNGVADYQWTRSRNQHSSNAAELYTPTGTFTEAGVTDSHVIRPCFTLPADMALTAEPYADGSWGLADEYEPSDEVVITENGIHNVDAYSFANVNVQSAPVLLWTNASPNNGFPAQNLNFNRKSSAYLVEFASGIGSYAGEKGIGYLPLSNSTQFGGAAHIISNVGMAKRVLSCTENSIQFGEDGWRNGAGGNNTWCIPLRIWSLGFAL